MGLTELCGSAPAHPDRIPVIPNGELITRLPRSKFDYQKDHSLCKLGLVMFILDAMPCHTAMVTLQRFST